jgi:hypothetical protein
MPTPNESVRLTISIDGDILFRYVNWRGEDHLYLVTPESVAYGVYDGNGQPTGHIRCYRWVLHANVRQRDGDPRLEMGPTRRRTFLLEKIKIVDDDPLAMGCPVCEADATEPCHGVGNRSIPPGSMHPERGRPQTFNLVRRTPTQLQDKLGAPVSREFDTGQDGSGPECRHRDSMG